jgi:hypothetical protein
MHTPKTEKQEAAMDLVPGSLILSAPFHHRLTIEHPCPSHTRDRVSIYAEFGVILKQFWDLLWAHLDEAAKSKRWIK